MNNILLKTSKLPFNALIIGTIIAAGSVFAQTLTLPKTLIAFNSPEGEKLLLESQSKEDFFPLSMQFVTQNNQAYCGVASSPPN